VAKLSKFSPQHQKNPKIYVGHLWTAFFNIKYRVKLKFRGKTLLYLKAGQKNYIFQLWQIFLKLVLVVSLPI
jgi:hypothetical protein